MLKVWLLLKTVFDRPKSHIFILNFSKLISFVSIILIYRSFSWKRLCNEGYDFKLRPSLDVDLIFGCNPKEECIFEVGSCYRIIMRLYQIVINIDTVYGFKFIFVVAWEKTKASKYHTFVGNKCNCINISSIRRPVGIIVITIEHFKNRLVLRKTSYSRQHHILVCAVNRWNKQIFVDHFGIVKEFEYSKSFINGSWKRIS